MPDSPPVTAHSASSAVNEMPSATTDACTPPTTRPSAEFSGAWAASAAPIVTVTTSATPRSISALLRVQPVRPDARVDGERRVEVGGADHLAGDDLRRPLHLLRRALEEQLVVDLQDRARPHALRGERLVRAHHRDLDDVGGGALDDRVDGQPLAELARLPVAGADLGDLAAAAEQRRDVAVLLGLLDRVLHELRDGGEAGQIAVDELLRLALVGLQAVGETVGGEPVDDPVVDHLGLRAHADVELLRRQLEDRAGGLGVDVLAALEDLAQDVLARDVGEHAQLDLRVVDAQQHVAGVGDEAGADLAAGLGPDRDVLQVRVDARQPARRGVDHQERRVDAAVLGDVGGQRVEVGLHELGQLAEALDLGDDLVLGADRLQHARVGAEPGLAAALARQPELDEQHLGELLRGADHELLAGQLPDLALEPVGVLADPGGGLLQPARVEPDARLLGLAQHAHERQLDLGQQRLQAALADLLALAGGQLGDQARALRLQVLGVDGDAPLLGELVERIAAPRGIEQE